MPEYLAPGVYVEEIELGAKPIEGVSTSTAGFLGLTERGPTAPRLVAGFEQFQRIYGGFIDNSYLAYAMDGFFRNGGKRCFVARITRIKDSNSTKNAVTTNADLDTIGIDAVGPGAWGNNIAIKITPGSLEELKSPPEPARELFKLTVVYWSERPPAPPVDPTDRNRRNDPNRREPTVVEVYDNLSHIQTSPDYYEKKVNGVSNLIKLRRLRDGRPADVSFGMLNDLPTSPAPTSGDDGSPITVIDYDGTETITDPIENTFERSGLLGFKEIDEISMVCAPDENSFGTDLTDRIVDHCEELNLYRFAILQAAQDATPSTIGTTLRPTRDSKYAAFYYPWIKVLDPRTLRDKLVPPGGHVAGIYARTDVERGVHKAPANEIVRGATALQFLITKEEQDILNPIGVNVIRVFPGRGIRVWGARTTSSDPLWKYVNVRRLFLFLEETLDTGTQFFVFEPNSEKLWDRVKQTITQFLTRVWRDGALMGTTPEEAFFVKVDRTTMTQDDIDNGRLICLIGVAPVKPAEFVIFRIAQTRGGAEVTEA